MVQFAHHITIVPSIIIIVLLNQRCQRYEVLDDLVKYRCTIEEREEYELHIEEGNLLFAGVDYEMILREAEKDADIVIWDGGNNDFSFYQPDLTICVADALREGEFEFKSSTWYPSLTLIDCYRAFITRSRRALLPWRDQYAHG